MAIPTLAADVRPAKINGAPADPSRPCTSRRALMGAAGLAVMAATTVPAAALLPLSEIERHWQQRCRAYREFEADPFVLEDDNRAKSYWARIDAAEIAILESSDSSARATEIRLWTAWSHTDRELAEAIMQGDVATLRPRYADFDWHEKLLFTAILALRGESQG